MALASTSLSSALRLGTEMAVLIGSTDAALQAEAEEFAASYADVVDVSTSPARITVYDADDFATAMIRAFPDRMRDIRLAFAPTDVSESAWHRYALLGTTLSRHAARLGLTADADADPDRYEVRFQPVVSLKKRTAVGFEALVRGIGPSGVIDAEELIRHATRSGRLGAYDQLMRNLSLRAVDTAWLGEGLLFLNLGAPGGQFDSEAIHACIDQAEALGISPDQIVFEAVEWNRYNNLTAAARQLREVRKRGIRIAVDDVGDGFSSLSVIAEFAPDVIKLNGRLTRSVDQGSSAAVVGAVVDMAHRMGAWVVGENVETWNQLRTLRKLGVDWGQGHFLGEPTAPLAGARVQ
ncbi:MAG: EAL domain-containing protein [Acidimicrobiales bacterium]|nr:EAL domain-containing protein [Acidimicrobiales bacterium]